MKKNHRHTLFASICFILLSGTILFGCGQASTQTSLKQKKFDRFLNSCFREYAAENTVTLHFKLSNPSAYGIKAPVSPTYGDLSSDALKKNCSRSKELLQKLYTFPTSSLTKKQKLTWQIFQDYLNESIMNEKYILYSSPLGTNGLQSEIPVTLSEYRLDNEKDIKDYLSLVNQVPELFTQILDFEQERRNAGLISPSFVISDTIDQIDQFLNASEENNPLIQSFEERLAEVESLSKDQKASYIANNRLLVTDKVLPAYKSLKTSLQAYTNDSKNTSSKERLCEYKNGQDYYKFLLMSNVGTDFSPEDCITILESQLKNTVKDISSLTTKNKDLYTEYLSATPALSAPKEIMNTLKNDSLIDFPEIKNISCQLKNIPDALSGTSACAFYLVPPIDSTKDNIIYINKSRVDSNELFSTLAHEGYPGHLYQTNYFLTTNPSPLRTFLHCAGYDEGWGTYAQLYSYNFIEFKNVDEQTTKQLRQLYRDNDLLSLSLSSLCDLYVNYKNYDENALANYLQTYGIDKDSAQNLYRYVIENPTTYLSYSIGCYELDQLKQTMSDSLGKAFKISDFHESVLNVGSCNFSILRQEIEKEAEILSNVS
ncbi:DUF885 domain-containing protein [Anaerobutyricum soehngenii]|jgi:uncharacterized protein (DUF885 family)|uniref:DUF885 domain-containing protein n=1 Tax=Anaerobutyricum soehngenii TaxID=105843 RepID=A0ABS3ZFM1_9FIRM|nr:DUF885 domain-containing protein [Anaerobutyricum soehngenii]MBP0056091.1 DUF885 domain-containing protein [Anaerobutyricum soehngenii]